MPKTTKKRAKVKNLPKPAKELSGKQRKKVKGGLLPAVQTSVSTVGTQVKIGSTGLAAKGGVGFGSDGLQ
jgi:hypothetical protein